MEKHKIIGEMYSVLLYINEEYNESKSTIPFEKYAKKRVAKLYEQAFDWLLEDEREKTQKIAQEI